MCKKMRKMMFGHKNKPMHKGCVSYVQENAQDDVWVQKLFLPILPVVKNLNPIFTGL